jgi:hypothetical protein
VPFAVLAALRAGVLCGSRAERNEANLTRFMNSPRVEVLYADEQTMAPVRAVVPAAPDAGNADPDQ